jgi:hypothetical protein
LCSGGLAYAYFQKIGPFHVSPAPEQSTTINYAPPTKEEITSSQEAKKNLPADSSASNSPTPTTSNKNTSPPGKKPTNVGISYADIYNSRLEIRAFTNTVIEGTGTCTATVVMKNTESMLITKSGKAFIDASSTVCEPLYIPVSELQAGTWKVSVAFSSPDHEGTSDIVEVKVP